MYIPDHFRMSEADSSEFLRQARTGTLVSSDPESGRPLATFLPWVVSSGDRLTSHIGRVNPQSAHGSTLGSPDALVILMGDDAYVCQEWLAPGSAPSWNYETVQVYGRLVTHEDPDWILQSWSDMLHRYSTTTLEAYDHDWLVKQARAVTGVEIVITEIQAKSKLSQNRSAADVLAVAAGVEPSCPHLAGRMRAVSLPHIAAREERVRNATPYTLAD